MLPTSDQYKQAVAASRRRILGRVSINYSDPFLDPSVTVDYNERAYHCWPQQAADSNNNPTRKWASLDGSWVLGEYSLCPDEEKDAEKYQMGWWGSSISNPDCTFSEPYPTIGVNFSSRPVRVVGVVGDSQRGEYPVDFNVKAYADATLVKTITVTDNDKVNWRQFTTPLQGISRLELEILKWSHPGRQAKILEFFAFLEIVYEGDDLFNLNLLEEREFSDGSLGVGNIASSEITVRVSNLDRSFDAGNIDSPLYGLVKPNRKIKPYLGVELPDGDIEWQPLGVFWSNDWSAPGQDLYAETSGFDALHLLSLTTYKGPVFKNISAYALVNHVLEYTGYNYFVDPALQDIVIPWAWFDEVSHREALRLIAEATLANVYAARNGTIRFEGPDFLINKEPVITITDDDYITKNNPANYGQIANIIEVEAIPLIPAAQAIEIYRSETPEIINGASTVTISYKQKPVINATVTLADATGVINISDIKYYAWGAEVTLEGNGSCVIVATGKPLEDQGSQVITVQDEASILEFGRLTYTLKGNHLIQTPDLAQRLADKCLAQAKDARRDLTLEWHGDPALELGDRIVVSDFGDTVSQFNVVRQQLDWDGGLKATLEAKRVTNMEVLKYGMDQPQN